MTLADQIPTWPDINMRIARSFTAAHISGMTKDGKGNFATATVIGSRDSHYLSDAQILAGHDDPYRDLRYRLSVLLARKLGVPEPNHQGARAGTRPDRYGSSAGPDGPSIATRKEHGG